MCGYTIKLPMDGLNELKKCFPPLVCVSVCVCERRGGLTESRRGKKANGGENEVRDGIEVSRNPSNKTQCLWFG